MKCSYRCSYPRCPNLDFKSPWEPDLPVDPMRPDTPPHHCTRTHIPRTPEDFVYTVTRPKHACFADTRHHTLVVLTSPRRDPSLPDTLESLRRAGSELWCGPKLIVSDYHRGGEPPPVPGWRVVPNNHDRPTGCARSFVRCLREALIDDPELDHLTFIEDDVRLCSNALHYMRTILIPEHIKFITWFTLDYDYSSPKRPRTFPHPSSLLHRNLATRSSRFFILTQACTFPRDTIELILRCPMASDAWPKRDGHDELISWALGDAPYAVHFPILVQHAGGLNSSVVYTRPDRLSGHDPQEGPRTSPYYVGDDFNALSLFK